MEWHVDSMQNLGQDEGASSMAQATAIEAAAAVLRANSVGSDFANEPNVVTSAGAASMEAPEMLFSPWVASPHPGVPLGLPPLGAPPPPPQSDPMADVPIMAPPPGLTLPPGLPPPEIDDSVGWSAPWVNAELPYDSAGGTEISAHIGGTVELIAPKHNESLQGGEGEDTGASLTKGLNSIGDRAQLARMAMQQHLERLEEAYKTEIHRVELLMEERIREQQAFEAELLKVRERRWQMKGPPPPPGQVVTASREI